MATTEDLKKVLKETLENRGSLSQIRARIRAEVFNALDDQTEPKPTLSNENLLINELLREYLEFNKYRYTSSVLQSETGLPKEALDREFIASELHIKDDNETAAIPLLYNIVSYFLQQRHVTTATTRSPPRPKLRQSTVDTEEMNSGSKTSQSMIVLLFTAEGDTILNSRTKICQLKISNL